MALKFWLGGAKSDKSTRMLEYILQEAQENRGRQYLYVVPEQYTLSIQRELVLRSSNHGVMNIDGLSFMRLAHRISDEVGAYSEAVTTLDDMGKNLLLQLLASRHQDELTIFAGNIDKLGYITKVKSLVSEFMQYGISPDKVMSLSETAAANGRSMLSGKLSDVGFLYQEFMNYIQNKYTTVEETLQRVASIAHLSQTIRNSVIVFDGFTGFTPVQLKLIATLLEYSRDIHVALLLDEAEGGDIFAMSRQTISTLERLADERRVVIADPYKAGAGGESEGAACSADAYRGGVAGASERINCCTDSSRDEVVNESESVSYSTNPNRAEAVGEGDRVMCSADSCRVEAIDVCVKNTGSDKPCDTNNNNNNDRPSNIDTNISYNKESVQISGSYNNDKVATRVFSGLNPIEEVRMTALKIGELIRSGYRYKDIAIITGDIDGYRDVVERVLAKSDIPYFVDKTEPLLLNPFVEYIRAFLQIFTDNYSYEAMMRYLKSGLTSIDRVKIDELDNYCLAAGIKGKKAWHSRFTRITRNFDADRIIELEKLREEITTAFDKFNVSSMSNVRDFATGLYEQIVRDDIENKLKEYEKFFQDNQDMVKAKEFGQVYKSVMDLLDELVELIGDEATDVKKFSQLMDAGLDAIRIGVIPKGSDYIQVGDLTRSRLNEIKALFILGVNDGIIPRIKSNSGIINEADREFLLEKDEELVLAPTAREDAFNQRLYIYMAMNKPSEKLFLSYSRLGLSGKSIMPSYLIRKVLKDNPSIKVENISGVIEERIGSSEDAMTELAILLGKITSGTATKEEKESAKSLIVLINSIDDELCNLDKKAADRSLKQRCRNMIIHSMLKGMSEKNSEISRAVAKAIYGSRLSGSVSRLETYANCAYQYFLRYGLKLEEREQFSFEASDLGQVFHNSLLEYSRLMEKEGSDWFSVTTEDSIKLMDRAVETVVNNLNMAALYSTARSSYMVRRIKRIMARTAEIVSGQVRAGDFVPEYFEMEFAEMDSRDSINIRLTDQEMMRLYGKIDRIDVCRKNNGIYVKIIDYKSGNKKMDLAAVYEGRQLQLLVYLNVALEHMANINNCSTASDTVLTAEKTSINAVSADGDILNNTATLNCAINEDFAVSCTENEVNQEKVMINNMGVDKVFSPDDRSHTFNDGINEDPNTEISRKFTVSGTLNEFKSEKETINSTGTVEQSLLENDKAKLNSTTNEDFEVFGNANKLNSEKVTINNTYTIKQSSLGNSKQKLGYDVNEKSNTEVHESIQNEDMRIIPAGILYYHIDDPLIASDGDKSDEEIKLSIMEKLKMTGFINEDNNGSIVNLMDKELIKDGVASSVIKAKRKKDGDLGKSADLVTGDDFAVMLKYVNNKMADIGREITGGNIAIPVPNGKDRLTEPVCDYCEYKDLCSRKGLKNSSTDTEAEGEAGDINSAGDNDAMPENTSNAVTKLTKDDYIAMMKNWTVSDTMN